MNINRIRFALQSCFLVLALAIIAGAQRQELKLEILNGHSGGGVLAVAVSSDGKFALTGSTDRTALLWDLETGKQLRRFVGHEDAVSAVQFSKDGQFVLTASYDKTARLWETATGKQVRVFVENRNGVRIGHSGKILTAAISADGLFVATASGEKAEIIGADDSITENCEDKTARIWNARTGNQLFLIEQTGCVNSIAFSPDSKLLLMGGEDKIARLYSTETGKEIKKFIGHNESITSVAYSPDGKQVLTGSSDKTVRLWNIELTSEIKKFNTEHDSKVSFLPNGSSIIVDDGNTRIIDIFIWK